MFAVWLLSTFFFLYETDESRVTQERHKGKSFAHWLWVIYEFLFPRLFDDKNSSYTKKTKHNRIK